MLKSKSMDILYFIELIQHYFIVIVQHCFIELITTISFRDETNMETSAKKLADSLQELKVLPGQKWGAINFTSFSNQL